MKDIFIAFGANLSNPKETFVKALDRLVAEQVELKAVSGLWKSPAWPVGQDYPDYLNAVARINYDGTADDLLSLLNRIEDELGRQRTFKNAPRVLDLDILDFRGEIYDSDRLILPHPRMLDRGFVLFPLQQVFSAWVDPVFKQSIGYHIARLAFEHVQPMQYLGLFYKNGRLFVKGR